MPKVIKRGTRPMPKSQAPASPRPATAAMPAGPGPIQRKRIIEREVVGATKEAADIKRRAELDAQRIVDESHEQAAETRQHGYEEGKQQALAQYTQEIAGALDRIRQIEEQLEPLYVGLIRDIVEKVIGQELKLNPDAIVGVVRNALVDARQQREIIVRIHPADVEALNKSRNKLLEMLARASSVELREDASITRGGCVVVTELGTIDASLERQLEALAAALNIELTESNADYDESELDPEDDPGAGY